MRVAVVNLTSGGLSGGYRKYLDALVPALARDHRVEELRVFLPAPVLSLLSIDPALCHPWPVNGAKSVLRWLQRELSAARPDVVFVPTSRAFDSAGVPLVIMVRNMEPLTVPFGGNPMRQGLRNLARAGNTWWACRRADRIIAVSKHVRRFLTHRWGLHPDRVGLVYHGVDGVDGTTPSECPPALADLRRAPFLFAAGSIRPARGLHDIVGALGRVHDARPDLRLVIAGQVDTDMAFHQRALHQAALEAGVDDRLVWAGELNRQQMAWCFNTCEMFVTATRAEACPNVALEALAHGCMVVSTSQDPMPEFFADAARYYAPQDSAALAQQIRSVLTAPDEVRRGQAAVARQRAASFTWSRTAELTLDELWRACHDRAPKALSIVN